MAYDKLWICIENTLVRHGHWEGGMVGLDGCNIMKTLGVLNYY